MDKLKRRQTMFSVFRTIAYFAGFPLLMLATFCGLSQMLHFESFEKTWYLGLLIVALPWLLASILQIVFGRFVKNQNLKTIVVVALVVLVTLGSAGTIDIYGDSLIKKTQATASEGKYKAAEVTVEDYYYQANWFDGPANKPHLVDDFMDRAEGFRRVYNLKYFGDNRSDTNVDNSPVVKGTEVGLGLQNVYVSPNGLLGEGSLFGIQDALAILIEYHEISNKALANGIDLEAEYDNIIATVKNGPEYKEYQANDENYLKAYGENGTAAAHMITGEELDVIIPVVTKYLSVIIKDVDPIVMGMASSLLKSDKLAAISSLDDLVTYANEVISSLAPMLDTLMGADSNPLRTADSAGYLTLSREFVVQLAEGYTYYYSPICRPVFDFIGETSDGLKEDAKKFLCDYRDINNNVVLTAAEVQRWAYARYYAKVHGANIGSVLIGDALGEVTLTSSGHPASFAFTLEELYQLEIDYSYIPQLYPLLVARRFLYILAGLCALSVILFYQFLKREKDTINEIRNQKGGTL